MNNSFIRCVTRRCKGVYSTIPFVWNDKNKTLTIGERQGSFPGMIGSRTFHIVFVGKGRGVGMEQVEQFDRVVDYNGKKVVVRE